jgi:hypothetical protein
MGRRRARSALSPVPSGDARSSDARTDSRAAIQLRLPRIVLISPLWASMRKGCASGHDGKVFVEKREWTIASRVWKRTSARSG